jgi:hypothetical protein
LVFEDRKRVGSTITFAKGLNGYRAALMLSSKQIENGWWKGLDQDGYLSITQIQAAFPITSLPCFIFWVCGLHLG